MKKLFLGAAAILLVIPARADPASVPTPQCSLENIASPDEIKAGWTLKFDPKVVAQTDTAPFEEGSGNWFVMRTTVTIPQCSAYDDMGNYSLRSYMLPKIVTQTKIQICRALSNGKSAPIPTDVGNRPADTAWEVYSDYNRPYAGLCPPHLAVPSTHEAKNDQAR